MGYDYPYKETTIEWFSMTVVRSIVFSEEKLRTKAVLFVGLVVLLEYGNLPPFWMEKFQ